MLQLPCATEQMNPDSMMPSPASKGAETPHYLLISLETAGTTQIHKDGKADERARGSGSDSKGEQVPLGVSSSVWLLRGSDSSRNLFTWGSQVCGMSVQECAHMHKSSLTHPPRFLKWRCLSGTWHGEILLSLGQRNTTPRWLSGPGT